MIIETTSIQGPVHTPKFNIGDRVEHINFGNSEGTITKILFAQNSVWYSIQQTDGFVIEEPEETLRLLFSKK